jgi:DNA-binding transcriptional LysR family regulator
VQPRVVLESANPDVLRQLVSLGLGWSVLPEAVARSGPEPLAAGERLAERSILGLRRRGGAADARAAAFLDAARAAGSGLR